MQKPLPVAQTAIEPEAAAGGGFDAKIVAAHASALATSRSRSAPAPKCGPRGALGRRKWNRTGGPSGQNRRGGQPLRTGQKPQRTRRQIRGRLRPPATPPQTHDSTSGSYCQASSGWASAFSRTRATARGPRRLFRRSTRAANCRGCRRAESSAKNSCCRYSKGAVIVASTWTAATGAVIRSRFQLELHQLKQMLRPRRSARRAQRPTPAPWFSLGGQSNRHSNRSAPRPRANQHRRHLRDQVFQNLLDGFSPAGRMLERPMGPKQRRRLAGHDGLGQSAHRLIEPLQHVRPQTACQAHRAAASPTARSARFPTGATSPTVSSLSRNSSIGNGRRAAAVSPGGTTRI